MNKLQKFIEDYKTKNGSSYKHIAKIFKMNIQTFHMMKKDGDITRMSIRKGLEMSEITGMSIEEMMEKAEVGEVCEEIKEKI
jgi:transposase